MIKQAFGFSCRGMYGLLRKIWKLFWGPKYDGKYLHGVVTEKFRETRLADTLTNVVIPTFDIKHLQPKIFSTYEVRPIHKHTHSQVFHFK